MKYLPNIITISRMIATLILLCIQPLSSLFFIIYTLAGCSDVLDGWIARKWNLISNFGSKLDSIADLLFYSITTILCFPTYWSVFPTTVWFCVLSVILIRIISYSYSWFKYKTFSSLHTYMNKAAGFSVFMIPYFVLTSYGKLWVSLSCLVNLMASFEELLIHIFAKEYNVKNQSILKLFTLSK